MGLKITYTHNHVCAHEGDKVVDRPDSNDGVTWIRIPWCEETLVELSRVSVEQI